MKMKVKCYECGHEQEFDTARPGDIFCQNYEEEITWTCAAAWFIDGVDGVFESPESVKGLIKYLKRQLPKEKDDQKKKKLKQEIEILELIMQTFFPFTKESWKEIMEKEEEGKDGNRI